MAKKFPSTRNRQEDRMVRNLDKLAKYEEFTEELLPALQKDLEQGLTAEQILTKWSAVAAAKMITAIATSGNPGAAIQAAKDVLDRTAGKATEKVEFTSKVEKMSDAELDALLKRYAGGTESEDTADQDVH